jgi:hypothetical protein
LPCSALFCIVIGSFLSLTLLILGCALQLPVAMQNGSSVDPGDVVRSNNWYPIFTVCFYMVAMIPLVFGYQMFGGDSERENACLSFGVFTVAVILTSIVGFPVVLYAANIITPGALGFSLGSAALASITFGFTAKQLVGNDDY